MDKITSSDPFGPLPKGDSYDPFDDSFPSSKIDKPSEEKVSSGAITEHPSEDSSDIERHSSFFGSTTSTGKTNFFSPFSPGVGKAKLDDSKWFEKEAESLFDESVNSNNLESTGSPIALNTSAPDGEQVGINKIYFHIRQLCSGGCSAFTRSLDNEAEFEYLYFMIGLDMSFEKMFCLMERRYIVLSRALNQQVKRKN